MKPRTQQENLELIERVKIKFKNPVDRISLENALLDVAIELKKGIQIKTSSALRYDPQAPYVRRSLDQSSGSFIHQAGKPPGEPGSGFDLHVEYQGNIAYYVAMSFDDREEGISEKELVFIDQVREAIYDHFGWELSTDS